MRKVFLTIFLLTTYYLLPAGLNDLSRSGWLTTSALAQFNLSEEIKVNVSPEYPKPNSTVYVSLEMYTENLDSSDISYYLNGKLEKSGKGIKNFSFMVGESGKISSLEVSVKLQNGTSFSKILEVTPAKVDILWQADSYTPPFYRGKALYGPQSMVRLFAETSFGSNNLIYKWSVDGEALPGISGYGKNTVSIKGSVLGQMTEIEVLVTDPLSGMTANSRLLLSPSEPNIIFYENHPLYGMLFDNAISGTLNLENEEINIIAAPYNVTKSDIGIMDYNWKINGISAGGIIGRSAILRKPGESVLGTSNISLEIANRVKPLQYGKGAFVIKFEKDE